MTELVDDYPGLNDYEKWSSAIQALNNGVVNNLVCSGRTYDIPTSLPPVTAHNFQIAGNQSMIRTSGTDARVFSVGTPQAFVRRALVKDFQVVSTEENAIGAAIEVENATDVVFDNIDPVNVPQYLHIGGFEKSASVIVKNARGSWRSASDNSPIFLESGAVVKLQDLDIFSPDAAPTSSSILIRPKFTMDTIEIMNCKIYARDGISRGLDVDVTENSVTNIWAGGNTFDRCVDGCFVLYAEGDINNWSKHMRLYENYARCMGGYVVDIVNNSSRADIDMTSIYNNNFGAVGDGCINAVKEYFGVSSSMVGLQITGNSLNDDAQYVTDVTRETQAVISMSVLNGFKVGESVVLGGFNGPLSFLNTMEVTILDIEGLFSVRVNVDTSNVSDNGNSRGYVTKARQAHIRTNVIATRITDNLFYKRVENVPDFVTLRAFEDIGNVQPLFSNNSVISPLQA